MKTSSTDSIVTRELSTLLHPLYADVPSPPMRLWVEGRESAFALFERLPRDGLAVVGTRSPDRRSVYLVQESLRSLRGTGRIIISGLARGIDSAAHEAALAAGLPTIAVLGCGIEQTYPPENARLRARILDAGGLIVSEFPPSSTIHPSYFIQRNRLIVGYAQAVWIVQSGYRSGALNTAARAKKMRRDLYVTPSFPGDPSFLGNESLLKKNEGEFSFWNAESLASTWISLFSEIEMNRRETADAKPLDLLLEIEHGIREGRSLLSILDQRSTRTGEPVEELIEKVERSAWS
ncbi:MAG: DNA-processing protein DprA [Cryobacterium sp.]|nr:DNA-processing protein DprA [Oligoflexia bacterium]